MPLDSALVEMIATRMTASVTARVTAQLREAASSSGSREGGSAQPEGATPRREESRTGDTPAEQHIRETGGKQEEKKRRKKSEKHTWEMRDRRESRESQSGLLSVIRIS